MIAPSHLVVGQFLYLTGALIAGHPPRYLEALAAAGAALLPDVDAREGYVGRWVPWLSGPLEHYIGHRTATHSLLVLLLVIALAWQLPSGWFLALTCGVGSHALADMMTPSGVAWLWPWRARCVIPGNPRYRMEAMGWGELVFVTFVGLLCWPLLLTGAAGAGVLGSIRDAIGEISDARRHFDAHKSERDFWLSIDGQDNARFVPIAGRFRVIGPHGQGGLIVETPAGPRSACRAGDCDWYARNAVIEPGAPEVTDTRSLTAPVVSVATLLDVLTPLERVGRVYLVGSVRIAHGVNVQPTATIEPLGQDRVQLHFAQPLELRHWPGVLRDVALLVQVRHPPGVAVPEIAAPSAPTLPAALSRYLN